MREEDMREEDMKEKFFAIQYSIQIHMQSN